MTTISGILEQLSNDIEGDEVSFGDIVEQFKSRGYGPLLFVPSLSINTPLGGIPTMPTFCAVVMFLVAVQLLLGRPSPWLPQFMAKQAVAKKRVEQSVEAALPWTKWIDSFLGDRLDILTNMVADRIVAFIIILLCFTIPPLELIPLAASAPGFCIMMFAIGLTVRDGLVTLIGLACTVAVGVLLWWLLPQIYQTASSLFGG